MTDLTLFRVDITTEMEGEAIFELQRSSDSKSASLGIAGSTKGQRLEEFILMESTRKQEAYGHSQKPFSYPPIALPLQLRHGVCRDVCVQIHKEIDA